MVIRLAKRSCAGWFAADLGVAIALLLFAVLPLAFSFNYERKLARAYYHRAIAGEIVDGEFETLLAGEWQNFPEGQETYPVNSVAATNLPPGQFLFTRRGTTIRLEWRAARGTERVVREAAL
jgi:hypothetical protein